MRAMVLLVSISFLLGGWSPAWGATWHVDASSQVSGDGQTWQTAFKTIQEGIDAASDGDTVVAAEGTYVENIHFYSKNITLTSTNPLDTVVVANTIIDGNESGSVITFAGTEDETCVLSGFTIRNGAAHDGRGIDGAGTLATIRNNTISSNRAGGLAHCNGTIEGNTITSNTSYRGGGLAFCHGTVQGNYIAGNWAAMYGGGLYVCNAILRNNRIYSNLAIDGGGGLYDCSGVIRANTISDNLSKSVGGGGVHQCGGTIENNTIVGNRVKGHFGICGTGGGLLDCPGTIRNNIIAGNCAEVGGGLARCHGMIRNNTIVANGCGGLDSLGGGVAESEGTIMNCIIWANTAETDPQIQNSTMPICSCIQDWAAGGEGNTDSDPRFADVSGTDYRLSPDSPCIDAGLNEEWMLKAVDLAGNPRLWNGTVDMGAHECGSYHLRIVRIARADSGDRLAWTSGPGDRYTVWSCANLTTQQWIEKGTVSSQGGLTSWMGNALAAPVRFYRIELKEAGVHEHR